jgi:hypothetical protein
VAFELSEMQMDLIRNTVAVSLRDPEDARNVTAHIKIQPHGNEPENRLKELAREAAKQALQDALTAL